MSSNRPAVMSHGIINQNNPSTLPLLVPGIIPTCEASLICQLTFYTKRRETVGTDTVRCVLLESPWEDTLKSQVREDMTVNSTCHTTSQHANS